MTNENANIDRERLKRMVERGQLTETEAARLQQSLDESSAQRVAMAGTGAACFPQKRPIIVLGICLLLLVLVFIGNYLMKKNPQSTSSATNEVITVTNETANPARPVDLLKLADERRQTMDNTVKFSGTVLVLIIATLVAGLLMLLYNSLIDSREKVNAGWAQVENVYQRRLDLIPVLIDGVKTYMEHERETLEALTEARSNALNVAKTLAGQPPGTEQQMQDLESSQSQLHLALTRLLVVAENYPDLKASRNFLALQDQIEGTENRIAMERRQFNEYARLYNSKVLKFPSNLVASSMGFTGKPYFQAADKALSGLDDPFGRGANQ